jgi:hypothetical protein
MPTRIHTPITHINFEHVELWGLLALAALQYTFWRSATSDVLIGLNSKVINFGCDTRQHSETDSRSTITTCDMRHVYHASHALY